MATDSFYSPIDYTSLFGPDTSSSLFSTAASDPYGGLFGPTTSSDPYANTAMNYLNTGSSIDPLTGLATFDPGSVTGGYSPYISPLGGAADYSQAYWSGDNVYLPGGQLLGTYNPQTGSIDYTGQGDTGSAGATDTAGGGVLSQLGNALTSGLGNLGTSLLNQFQQNPLAVLGSLLGGANSLLNYNKAPQYAQQLQQQNQGIHYTGPGMTATPYHLPTSQAPQVASPGQVLGVPGLARGGALSQFRSQRLVSGPGGGQDDKVDARLSPGEYVFDADTVSALGDGSNDAGAAKLDQMRQSIRQHKRSAPPTKIPPKAKAPEQYMNGGRHGRS